MAGNFLSKLKESDDEIATSLIETVDGFLRGNELILFVEKKHQLSAAQSQIVKSILANASGVACQVIEIRTQSFWNGGLKR